MDKALQVERFPETLRRRLHIKAAELGISMRQLILDAIRAYLDTNRK